MKFKLDEEVKSNSLAISKGIVGTIQGIFSGQTYRMMGESTSECFNLWDEKYPGWDQNPVYLIHKKLNTSHFSAIDLKEENHPYVWMLEQLLEHSNWIKDLENQII